MLSTTLVEILTKNVICDERNFDLRDSTRTRLCLISAHHWLLTRIFNIEVIGALTN